MKFKLLFLLLILFSSSQVYAQITIFTGYISVISVEADGGPGSAYVRIKGLTSAGLCKPSNVDPEIQMMIGTGPADSRLVAILVASKLNGTPVTVQLDDLGFINPDGRCKLMRLKI